MTWKRTENFVQHLCFVSNKVNSFGKKVEHYKS